MNIITTNCLQVEESRAVIPSLSTLVSHMLQSAMVRGMPPAPAAGAASQADSLQLLFMLSSAHPASSSNLALPFTDGCVLGTSSSSQQFGAVCVGRGWVCYGGSLGGVMGVGELSWLGRAHDPVNIFLCVCSL